MEETKIEEQTQAPAVAEVQPFVQGEKSEAVEKALAVMKELRMKFELSKTSGDTKDVIDLALYEFPKMMNVIREVEDENLVRREGGVPEFRIEETPEYKGMTAFGLTPDHMKRQRELAEQYKDEKK
ncbi:MAG: hypothetical protein WCT49_03670 [Candidatus Paceibacterota bacterium]|jgi:hypothetical protein|nr:hypothetical protein [Candidatus Paceibacterota bacterium]